MSWFMLVCAVMASLAVGVFLAQGVCLLIFRAFPVPARKVEPKIAGTMVDLESIAG